MADTFYGAAKEQFKEGLKDRIFGQGLLGRSLRAGFEAKFSSKKDSQVIQNQDSDMIEKQNTSILQRIDVVVTNISDNIYNIAGVLNAQLTSMKETEEEMRRQELQRLVSEEEQLMEFGSKPSTQSIDKPKAEKKDNILDSFSKSFSLFKNSISRFASGLSSILKSRKFLALAGVAAAGGAMSYAMSKDKDLNEESENEQQDQATAVAVPTASVQSQSISSEEIPNKSVISSNVGEGRGNINPPMAVPDVGGGRGNINPPMAVPEQTSSVTEKSPMSNIFNLAKQQQAEKNEVIKQLILENKYSGNVPEDAPELQEINKKYQGPMIQTFFSPSMISTKPVEISQKTQNLFQSLIDQKRDNGPSIITPSMGGSGSFSINASMPSGESAEPVFSTPSSGSMISEASTNVEAMSENFQPPTISNIDNSASNVADTSEKTIKRISSPVADRGSLDKYSFFNG